MRITILLLLLLGLLIGCEEQKTARNNGEIFPSAAYLEHFGEPPVPQQGQAYAQVGFLPLAGHSGKVSAIPLFMFSADQQLDRLLSQLFSERLVVSTRSTLVPPYTQGVRLVKLDQAGDTLVVDLQLERSVAEVDLAGIERAVTETATQFDAVSRVRIRYDEQPSRLQPPGGYRHQGEAIVAVGAPILLDVVGVWEPGDKDLAEILVNFDRPVSINGFRLLDKAGNQVGGKYYNSIFNMAVVVHPTRPEDFPEGTPLNISWDVEDALGRRNSALDSFPLVRQQH